jgi:hypothetical protein
MPNSDRMIHVAMCLAIAALLAVPFASAKDRPKPAAEAKTEPGFKSIFNGKTLEDWEGNAKAWTVKDGAIQSTGGKTKRNWLMWRGGEPGDFELRLSFKYTAGNSGVQVRSKEIDKWQVRGYQVEVAPQSKMGLWHHSLSPEKYRSTLATAGQKTKFAKDGKKSIEQVDDAKKIQAAFKEGDWNELTIIAKGPLLIQKINGVVFAELTDEDEKYSTSKGLIALQDHGKGTVAAFKNIRIKLAD